FAPVEAIRGVAGDEDHADIGQEARQSDIGKAHGIVGGGVDIPADGNVEHLGAQLVEGANGDEAAKRGLPAEEMENWEMSVGIPGCCGHGKAAPWRELVLY